MKSVLFATVAIAAVLGGLRPAVADVRLALVGPRTGPVASVWDQPMRGADDHSEGALIDRQAREPAVRARFWSGDPPKAASPE